MKIYSSEQLHRLDAYTIEADNISSIDLMERAASAFTESFLLLFETDRPVVVFAGPGNNGGDALAVSRMLVQKGFHVSVYLFNTGSHLSADCAANKQRLEDESLPHLELHEVVREFRPPHLGADTVVIDGLFGTGLCRFLSGGFAAVVKYVNASPATVVAIDMPSGLMAEDNSSNVMSNVMRADYTLTFHAPKLSFFFPEIESIVGEWQVLDIGLKDPLDASTRTLYEWTEEQDVRAMLKTRSRFAHKGMLGHALLVAGKKNMAGAAVLAARSCLRTGVGKLTVHTQEANRTVLQVAVPEAILNIGQEERFRDAPAAAYESLVGGLQSSFDAIAVGPAIGTDEYIVKSFARLLPSLRMSAVFDADAINIIASHQTLLAELPRDCILTPHKGELHRLIGKQENSYAELQHAIELARHHSIFLLLKGHYTACITPFGKVFFNSTGNSGMATAGSGDVLTGIILSLLAQQYTSEEAMRLGAYLHGLAGDLAVADLSEESLIASDITTYLPQAFRRLHASPAVISKNTH